MPVLTPDAQTALLVTLQRRFETHARRHPGLDWALIAARLEAQPERLWSLAELERTAGEPDVIGVDAAGGYVFCDCAAESPAERRSLCYDGAALAARKTAKPAGSALEQAAAMGVRLLTETEYHALQQLGPFDQKTSSWVLTPPEVRQRGGALFGDYRYGRVFIYHNGAESYYGARGWRGLLVV